MRISFESIVNLQEIGRPNSRKLNDLLALASKEAIAPSSEDKERVLFLGIDIQNDFMENGALPVPNSHRDVENATRFLYKHMEKITSVAVSIDTHQPQQIFHPSWWMDENGNHPEPLTIITARDVAAGKWKPVKRFDESLEYVTNLERAGKKQLCIWAYHCIQGTYGAALEGQFSNMVHFHSVARNSEIQKIVKGLDPLSEMYGIIKPEYDKDNYCNSEFLESLKTYDKIIVAGEAKSHCVLESVKQMAEHYKDNKAITSRIFLLEDCMSPIPGFERVTEEEFSLLERQYELNVVSSNDFSLAGSNV